MTTDYKNTVFLPQTDFPMRAGLPQREPETLARWKAMDLYALSRKAGEGREKFVLHDGPPYANGHLHIGHALNKILKDVIVRSQQMMGKDSNYVPGWDCHGLPIEWKIEEKYRAAGKDKDQIPVVEFRKECREFATHWLDVQREEFQRLGLVGDWDHPYATMNFEAEALIAAELGKFLMNGSLYKGAKPVMWSVVEKTALAEAEVEYHDHSSQTIHVRFPVTEAPIAEMQGACVVIWTTTPWTIPGNRAVAYGAFDYGVFEVKAVSDDSMARVGERLIVAEGLAEQFVTDAGIVEWTKLASHKGLDGVVCKHPFAGFGYEFDVRALKGDFVTLDTGTGIVHIAPGHGADDWVLGMEHGVPVPDTVNGDGTYTAQVPMFEGLPVLIFDDKKKKTRFPANKAVADKLAELGMLLSTGRIEHSYPHSWRSKAPVIFRNTPQWFISMEKNDLRDTALKAIEDTRFVPSIGKNRLRSMIAERPDWCVSRQRAWGVPIAVFVNKNTGEPLRDQAVLDRIIAAFKEEGADAWYTHDAQYFLGADHKAEDFDQVTDILDVWFDSGCTHSFVLEQRPNLKWPADLYLEGSDQHRGWFHSSLLESCGTRGRAPYDAVLTHGFILDQRGDKMSKSVGNTITPKDVEDQYGVDILRLWVVSSDYTNDLPFGDDILKQNADVYRRLRNTLRYLLGNLDGFQESERLPFAQMPELERWVLHRLRELDGKVRKACDDFHFHPLFTELHNFCTVELSAFYFDVRKDTLYCERTDSTLRRACRTVLDEVFNCLTAWLAPFICFTAEEAWLARNPGEGESVHLRLFPDVPAEWLDDALAAKWSKVRELRRVVTGALEIERAEKRIGSSLQAAPKVYATADYVAVMNSVDLAEIAITSMAELIEGEAPAGAFTIDDVPGVGVVPTVAVGDKCERCWKVTEDVGSNPQHPTVCGRCADAVESTKGSGGAAE
ncbi:isoleucine--tRNA ligase [Magnetovibrio blakemorei]|uniref:Isoleucine--tRNA ligase n=1 Tax=Magnetovibrio blakemorei TaxID=28181 RepID=A0A1E5Q855_9PROT|nr:isoleucine--tRNA ligase [Magnetovibrio blakemorei]OEJ67561.1 isoleucine--tRNA ligase [Magnetovibrio blakemorei]